jgi:hypothetical protein
MPRLAKHLTIAILAFSSLPIGVSDLWGATPPIRTANSRMRQIDPNTVPAPVPLDTTLPVAPVPVPPAPGLTSPMPMPGAASPSAPVPPPEPNGGPMYSQPFGTFKDRTPPPKQYLGDPDGNGSYHTPTDAPIPSGQPLPALDPNAPLAATDRFGVAPPPGTLGHTYHRRSRLLDEKKHPRVGVVEVQLSENYDVSAKGLKSKWTGKVWELESDPLLPGVPHIFEVKAEWGPEGARRKEVRTIRLIMGRAVDLEF